MYIINNINHKCDAPEQFKLECVNFTYHQYTVKSRWDEMRWDEIR